jgi:putative Mg2+ transporter-C (MgtC) family protein
MAVPARLPAETRCDDCPMSEIAAEAELILRLVLAGVVGALIGIEREVHGHPAGMRTHLLVALGSAVFTVLSVHGFASPGAVVDPTRIAAQIVSGIGFLGAGAILKEGFTIRGLTTAASLWTTAALGMAAGVGEYAITVATTAIALISLWPLRPISDRLEGARRPIAQVRLEVETLEDLARAREALRTAGIEITGMRSRRLSSGRLEAELEVRRGGASDLYGALGTLSASTGAIVTGIDQTE